jgi:hypothetical protein
MVNRRDSAMNKTKQHPNSPVHNSSIQTDRWNSKFQALADTLRHHIREEEDHEKHESKGVYIDFKQLK